MTTPTPTGPASPLTALDLSTVDRTVLVEALELCNLRLMLAGQETGENPEDYPYMSSQLAPQAARVFAHWMNEQRGAEALRQLSGQANSPLLRASYRYATVQLQLIAQLVAELLSAEERTAWYELLSGSEWVNWRMALDHDREFDRIHDGLTRALSEALRRSASAEWDAEWPEVKELQRGALAQWVKLALNEHPNATRDLQQDPLRAARWALHYRDLAAAVQVSERVLRDLNFRTWAKLQQQTDNLVEDFPF